MPGSRWCECRQEASSPCCRWCGTRSRSASSAPPRLLNARTALLHPALGAVCDQRGRAIHCDQCLYSQIVFRAPDPEAMVVRGIALDRHHDLVAASDANVAGRIFEVNAADYNQVVTFYGL